MVKIYVGNLPYQVTEDEVKQAFAEHGAVETVSLITDRQTGRPKGYGFVEMTSEEEAKAAIAALNGKDLGGRAITVDMARPKTEGPSRGPRGPFRGGRDRE